eukprot:ctg_2206.g432
MYDASDAEDASAFHAESTPRYRAALPSQSEGTPDSLDDREALAADRIGSRDRRDARRLDDIGAGWQASALHFGAHPAPSSVNEGIANALCCSTLRRGLHLLAADTGDVSAALPENTRSRLAALDFASALRLETGDVAKGDPQGRWRLSEWMDVERYKTLGIDCLLFDVAGQSTRCRYPRQELLRDLQRGAGQATQYPYVQSSDDAFIRNSVPVIADDTASPARCRSAFAQAVRHGTPPSAVGMPKMRDLRLVDPAFQADPALVVREGVIFVVLDDQLRSVIQSDRVLVFAPDSVPTKHARPVLAERLAAAADSWYAPFEFVVLEALLVAGSDLLEAEVSRLERRIDLSLATLRRRITKERAEQLRLLKARLLRLAQRCRTFRDALTRALDDEQTLRHGGAAAGELPADSAESSQPDRAAREAHTHRPGHLRAATGRRPEPPLVVLHRGAPGICRPAYHGRAHRLHRHVAMAAHIQRATLLLAVVRDDQPDHRRQRYRRRRNVAPVVGSRSALRPRLSG